MKSRAQGGRSTPRSAETRASVPRALNRLHLLLWQVPILN